jgi:hypothetical protein
MADKDEDTTESDAVVVEGTVDNPPAPSGDAPSTTPPPSPGPPPSLGAGSGGTSPAAADRHAAEETDPFSERPELFVAGAFVGGLVLAKVIDAIFGEDD